MHNNQSIEQTNNSVNYNRNKWNFFRFFKKKKKKSRGQNISFIHGF